MRHTLLFALFTTLCHLLKGQTITLSGYVMDSVSRERQTGVVVYEKNSLRQTLSNEYGFFSLTISVQGDVTLIAKTIGYQPLQWTGKVSRDTILSLYLTPAYYMLQGVDIRARRDPSESGNKMILPMKTIKELPALAGQTDVLRSFQLLPGISGGSEGSAGLHIRGGSADQNLIVMDDVPLYYVNHLGGFLSIFNADAIQNVQVYKGNPPARFGGRLSGVTDIRLRDGNSRKHEASIEMGLLAASLLAEGPIGRKKRTTYLVSLRRFNYDFILQGVNLFREPGYKSPYFTFSDVNAKVSHVFSEKDRISWSFFTGSDRLIQNSGRLESGLSNIHVSDDRYKLSWGNKMAAFRWNHIWNPKLFSNLTASLSEFKYESNQYAYFATFRRDIFTGNRILVSEAEQRLAFNSRIRDAAIRWDFEWSASNHLSFKFGAAVTQHWFRPNVSAFSNTSTTNPIDSVFGSPTLPVIEPSAYTEVNWAVTDKITVSGGLHWAAYRLDSAVFSLPQPQVAVSYQATPKLSFHASANSRYQGLHLLTGSGVGLPLDLWLPATKNAPPQRSAQAAAGSRISLGGRSDWTIHADVYIKRFSQQIDFQEGASFFTGSQEWEEKIVQNGVGLAYGLELLIEKKRGKTSGWLSYTWSKNNRKFAAINEGEPYPYQFDRRHNLALVAQRDLRPNIKLSANWVFTSGAPITLPASIYPAIQPGYQSDANHFLVSGIRFSNALYYNRRNDYRMRAYHRLDVSVQFTKQKRNGVRLWTLGAYNAYNQLNPFFLYYGFDRTANHYRLYQYTLFPIIPSVSYRRSFSIGRK